MGGYWCVAGISGVKSREDLVMTSDGDNANSNSEQFDPFGAAPFKPAGGI